MSEQDDTFPGQEVEVTVSFFCYFSRGKISRREIFGLKLCVMFWLLPGSVSVFIVKGDSSLWLVVSWVEYIRGKRPL